MKNIICFLIFFGITISHAQTTISSEIYQKLKSQNLLNQSESYKVISNHTNNFSPSIFNLATTTNSSCSNFIEPDSTYIDTISPSDDGFTLVNLPFNFCFFNSPQQTLYINTNGNVSFGSPYSNFSGSGFPNSSFSMVAPFWADVDTRGTNNISGGKILYKVTSSHIIVSWMNVGYYNKETDKKNTFQVILTNGNDPILPNGKNVSFRYKQMEWTTGNASQGTNGFGGVPATVGANKGDNVSYITFGRFNKPGYQYDGPVGQNDGVSWLSHRSFNFNSCASSNLPPFIGNIPACDTINVCVGDTFYLEPNAISINQNLSNSLSFNGLFQGTTVLSNTNGNPANAKVQVVATSQNIGFHSFTTMAINNSSPVDTSYSNIVFAIRPTIQNQSMNIADTIICPEDSAFVSANPGYHYYEWSNGMNTSGIYARTGQYIVKFQNKYCEYGYDTINVLPSVIAPNITGDTIACWGDMIQLSVPDTFDLYFWSNSSDSSTTQITNSGSYSVNLKKNNCNLTSNVHRVHFRKLMVNIQGDTTFCEGDSVLISVQDTFDFYNWSSNDTVAQTYVSSQGKYTVSVTKWGCESLDSINIYQKNTPIVELGNDTLIPSGTIIDFTINTPDSNSVLWSNGSTSKSTSIYFSGLDSTVYVTVTSPNGCSSSDSILIRSNTNINEHINKKILLQAYPNPTNKELNIKLASGNNSPVVIQLYSIGGQIVKQKFVHSNKTSINIDLSENPKGLYLLKIISNQYQETYRVVKM